MGTGAMACLFAARLSAAGINVKMFGTWEAGLRALQQNGGVRMITPSGIQKTYPVKIISSPSDCKDVLYSIVLVKSWQTSRAAHQLAQCLAQDGIALTLQNGMGNWEVLQSELGDKRVVLGATTVGATLLEPGQVLQAGDPFITVCEHPNVMSLFGLLKKAGFIIETTADPNTLLWGKLIINAAINPITALLRIPNRDLLKHSSTRLLLQSAANEAYAVATAKDITLPFSDPWRAVEGVALRTGEN